MTEERTIYDALQAFDALTQAVTFSSNEHALLFALLRTWNAARRPTVIEQWANTTCANAGLTKDTMPSARNKLVQKGVIFYDKEGNRGVPRYSLNALFEIEDPFLLREIRRKPPSNPRSKRRVSDGVNGGSYQEKEKGKGQDKGGGPLDDLSESKPDGIPTIEEAQRFVLSDPSMIPPDCVESWHDDRTSMGWEKPKGQTVVPIRDWRADLRGYGRNWKENRVNRPDAPKPPPKAVEGPTGWQEAFREIIPNGPIPVQWSHVDPDLRGEIQNQLKDAS